MEPIFEQTAWIGWHCDWCSAILWGKYPRWHVFDDERMRHPVAIVCNDCKEGETGEAPSV